MGISKGNSIIFVIHLSIEFLFLQQILPSLTMKSISILIFAALIMSGAADLPIGGGTVSGCCNKAGVPSHCLGLCTPVPSVARSLENRINACTEYDEDIEKCWDSYEKIREQPIPEPDTIEKSEPPVPEKKVKPVTKGQFLLIEVPELNVSSMLEKPAMHPWNETSRCGCCCSGSCCSLHPQCCCTPC